jgi:signal transduction histidine kinase
MRALRVLEPYLRVGLPPRLRDVLAVGAILVSVVLGLAAVTHRLTQLEDGIRLHLGPDRITIAEVSPWGAAARSPLRAGMVVVRINAAQVGEMSTDPELPRQGPGQWPALLAEPLRYIEAMPVDVYDHVVATGDSAPLSTVQAYLSPRGLEEESWPAMVSGVVLLAGMWWWLLGKRTPVLRRLAAPASAAASVPLLLLPYAMSWGYTPYLASSLILPLAFLPLADGLAGLLPGAEQRRVRMALLTATLVAIGGGLLLVQTGSSVPSVVLAAALAGGVLLTPAAQLYWEGRESPLNATQPALTPLELAAIVLTPLLSLAVLAFRAPGLLWLLVFWVVVLAAAQRFTIAPLTRAVRRTRLQRDLVVEATEAERARIATDLHDVALQELTMLAMRLDAKGDAESADAARDVAERVREICGDLRLPLLDDFGVGPALEWLVDRLERVAPGRITLEQNDGARLPPEVELAIFRVAQEALGNAVRHGSPPIVVRFQAAGDRASLSIDDAGPGIGSDAGEAAQQTGRFGLLNMQQRAEQVGALLDIRRWPAGGTHVGLEWRAT